jgi:TRAP-type C4-dicarboxylate transport system permease small subunit
MLAALVAISIGLTAFLIPLNLLLIKVRWGSIWWLHEAVEYALYFGVFVGAPWVLHQGAHVKVDVITSALSPQAAARVEKFMDLVGCGSPFGSLRMAPCRTRVYASPLGS